MRNGNINTTNGVINTTNKFFKAKRKRAHTSRPGVRPIIARVSSSKSDSFDDTNFSKSKTKKHCTNKNSRKQKKQDSSDSLSSNSNSSNDSDYIGKQHKKKIHQKKGPIKLCARLKAEFLTTVEKSKIIKFKLDEDPLQLRICFLMFVESPEMIFPSIEKLMKYS